MWIAITAQVLTGAIALGLLWKDWHELKKRHRGLPFLVLLFTIALTAFSVVLVIDGARDSERLEAGHKGEAHQFQATLKTLLDRIDTLKTQVDTTPLLKQNEQLQQDLKDTKKLVQDTKDQVGKPAPKAVLEAMFASPHDDAPKGEKVLKTALQPDGSLEFRFIVMNTSLEQAGQGAIAVRICDGCTYISEPERFVKIPGAFDTDREMDFGMLPARGALTVSLKVKPPTKPSSGIKIGVTSRCANCSVRSLDELTVWFSN